MVQGEYENGQDVFGQGVIEEATTTPGATWNWATDPERGQGHAPEWMGRGLYRTRGLRALLSTR